MERVEKVSKYTKTGRKRYRKKMRLYRGVTAKKDFIGKAVLRKFETVHTVYAYKDPVLGAVLSFLPTSVRLYAETFYTTVSVGSSDVEMSNMFNQYAFYKINGSKLSYMPAYLSTTGIPPIYFDLYTDLTLNQKSGLSIYTASHSDTSMVAYSSRSDRYASRYYTYNRFITQGDGENNVGCIHSTEHKNQQLTVILGNLVPLTDSAFPATAKIGDLMVTHYLSFYKPTFLLANTI